MIKYRRNGRDVDEDEALDATGVLRDGFSVTVPLTMRDALARGIRLHDGRARVTDGDGGTSGLHRPGFRVADNAAMRDAREEAYRLRDEEDRNAWRGSGAEVPDERQRDALPARDGMTLDELQRDHHARMRQIYNEFDRELEQRWRAR